MGSDREYGRMYPVAKAIVKPAALFLWRFNVTGLHNVPEHGPAIFCPNHISFFDSIVLPTVLPRRISYVGKAEYLDSWKTRYLFPALGMIPIDRGGGSSAHRALDTAARVLERGELFGIYPEGTRSRTGKLHRGRTGAARLSLRTGAPIIPVGIRGTDRIQPTGAPVPRPFLSCQINIGAPIDVSRYADGNGDRLLYRALIDEVMFEIRKLSGQDYADVYADKAPPPGEPTERPTERPPELATEPAQPGVFVDEGAQDLDATPLGDREEVGHDRSREPVLVGAGRRLEEGEQVPVDERRSSAEVLARWWS